MSGDEEDRSSTETWNIHVPITLSPNKKISLSGPEYVDQIGGWKCSLTGEGQSYLLKIYGIPTEAEAEKLLHKLCGGLQWTRAVTSTGIRVEPPQKVKFFEDPVKAAHGIFGSADRGPVYGAIDGAFPAIVPANKRIATLTGFPVGFLLGVDPHRFVASVAEGASLPMLNEVLQNERFSLSSELYSDSHFEASFKARFLVQMTALEVLAVRPPQRNDLHSLVCEWEAELARREKGSPDETDISALQRLKSRVADLKKESISESVKILVRNALLTLDDPSAPQLNRKIGTLYAVRSAIAHGRNINVGQSMGDLQEIVNRTLCAVMKNPGLIS